MEVKKSTRTQRDEYQNHEQTTEIIYEGNRDPIQVQSPSIFLTISTRLTFISRKYFLKKTQFNLNFREVFTYRKWYLENLSKCCIICKSQELQNLGYSRVLSTYQKIDKNATLYNKQEHASIGHRKNKPHHLCFSV